MELEKTIDRIGKQIIDWQGKLQDYEKELKSLNPRLKALEARRDSYILPARALGEAQAKIKLDSANIEVEKLKKEEHELTVLVTEVKKKISELETQKADYERKEQIFELNAMRDKRADMAKEIEKLMGELLPVLSNYRDLGRQMYTLGKALECGHASLYTENKLGSYLHGQLGKILPSDFQSTLSRRVESLGKVDLETIDAVLEAHGLRVASDTEGKAVANGE